MPAAAAAAATLDRRPTGSIPIEELHEVLYVVTPLHLAMSLLLIVLVLLHSGKGGGLSDMFGGGMGASAAGSTVMEKNLDRITVVSAVVWSFTTIALGMLLTNS